MKKQVWDQVKNITARELMAYLRKDKWRLDVQVGGSMHIFKKGPLRVSVHFHSGKNYGAKMLKKLLADISWSETDMKRLKIIK